MTELEPHQRMVDRTLEPSNGDIITFIANTEAITTWKQLEEYLETHYDLLIETIYYGDTYGWLVRYRKGKRTIVSLFPEKNSFSVLIVYGTKEIDTFAAQESQVLPAVVDLVHNTKKLHDGKWLWIRVTDSTYLEDLKKLIAIKRKPNKTIQKMKNTTIEHV